MFYLFPQNNLVCMNRKQHIIYQGGSFIMVKMGDKSVSFTAWVVF